MNVREDRLRRIALGFSRIGIALRGLAWKRAAAEGVTPTQGEILQQLADSPAPLRLGAVAGALSISAPTASDAVSSLVKKGLAAKLAQDDKRAVTIRLTAAGEDLIARTRDWPRLLEEAAGTLSEQEQAATLRALTKIIASLQDEGAIFPQRLCVSCRHFRPFAHGDRPEPHHCALIDRAYGDLGLQLSCPDHEQAEPDQQKLQRQRFDAIQST